MRKRVRSEPANSGKAISSGDLGSRIEGWQGVAAELSISPHLLVVLHSLAARDSRIVYSTAPVLELQLGLILVRLTPALALLDASELTMFLFHAEVDLTGSSCTYQQVSIQILGHTSDRYQTWSNRPSDGEWNDSQVSCAGRWGGGGLALPCLLLGVAYTRLTFSNDLQQGQWASSARRRSSRATTTA